VLSCTFQYFQTQDIVRATKLVYIHTFCDKNVLLWAWKYWNVHGGTSKHDSCAKNSLRLFTVTRHMSSETFPFPTVNAPFQTYKTARKCFRFVLGCKLLYSKLANFLYESVQYIMHPTRLVFAERQRDVMPWRYKEICVFEYIKIL
jgi:hypothetical protein